MGIKISNKCFLGLIQVLILAFLWINGFFHDISILSVFKLFLFQLFGWFIIGYAVFLLLRINVKCFADVIALSYSLGGIASVVTYLIFMIFSLGLFLPYVLILESGVATIYLFKTKRDVEAYKSNGFTVLLCVVSLFVFCCLVTTATSFVNTMPNENVSGGGFFADLMFWAGNNISFTRSFPADTFRQIGIQFRYHYFSSLLMAFVSLCTGININQITFYFSGIFAGVLLVFASFYFSYRIIRSKFFIVLLFLAVLFTDGTTACTFAWHTIICPFGFDYGYAYGLMSLGILEEIIKQGYFIQGGVAVCSCLYIAMTTGCKGPVGLVILSAYGVIALYLLFNRGVLKGIEVGFLWLMSFAITLFIFIYSHINVEETYGLQFIGGVGIDSIVTKNPLVAIGIDRMSVPYKMGQRMGELVRPFFLLLYIYRINIVVITLMIIGIGFLIIEIKNKNMDLLLISMTICAVFGLLLLLYTKQAGSSQMYFMMAALPAASLAGVYSLEQLKQKSLNDRRVDIVYKVILFIVVMNLGISVNQHHLIVMDKVRRGVAVIRNTYDKIDYQKNGDQHYVDNTDYEAYDWIRNNTCEDSIIAVDRFMDEDGNDISMVAGVVSERFIWNETKYVPDVKESERRNSIVNKMKSDPEGTIDVMKSEGVDYMLCHTNEIVQFNFEQVEEVFRNSRYIIYKLI